MTLRRDIDVQHSFIKQCYLMDNGVQAKRAPSLNDIDVCCSHSSHSHMDGQEGWIASSTDLNIKIRNWLALFHSY